MDPLHVHAPHNPGRLFFLKELAGPLPGRVQLTVIKSDTKNLVPIKEPGFCSIQLQSCDATIPLAGRSMWRQLLRPH